MADKDGFDEFVVSRSPALLRTAYLLVHDEGLAEDLVQTALTKSWFAWRRIEGDPEPYVRRVLATTSVSWCADGGPASCPPPTFLNGRHRKRPTGRRTSRTCGTRSVICRDVSGPWWCCATSRTAARPRRPTFSTARWGP